MWQFVTETWIYDPNISRLVAALAVLVVVGIAVLIYAAKTKRRLLKILWLIGVAAVVIVLVSCLAVDSYCWLDKWEGRIIGAYSSKNWSFRTGANTTSYFLKIKLDDVGPERTVVVSPSTYSQVGIGYYIVKKKGGYYPEVQ